MKPEHGLVSAANTSVVHQESHRCEQEKEVRLGSRARVRVAGDFSLRGVRSRWKEFAVDYDLEKGDGIMFSLVDRRRFHVNVFDKFGMEKLSTKQRASPTHSTSVGAEDCCRTHGLLQPMPNRNQGHIEPAVSS